MRTFSLKMAFINIPMEKVMTSFLRFRVSRPGHFKELRMWDAYPLPVPLDFARGQGVPHT